MGHLGEEEYLQKENIGEQIIRVAIVITKQTAIWMGYFILLLILSISNDAPYKTEANTYVNNDSIVPKPTAIKKLCNNFFVFCIIYLP